MRTVSKSKNSKHGSKKEFTVHNQKTGMRSIEDAAGIEPVNSDVSNSALIGVSAEERNQLIAKAAYHRAEQRSFAPGHELEDWLTAEDEIKARLTNFVTDNSGKNSQEPS
jgi:hypothetical protein